MQPLRALIRSQVLERCPVDDREQASIEYFIAEFDRLESPFCEDADPVHVTASGIVIGSRGVLLLRHRRLGIWVQPGGHLDPDEMPWVAAWRETIEESGLDLDLPDPTVVMAPVHVDVHPGPRGHTHLDLRYLIEAGEGDPAPPPGESQEIGWFDWTAAIEIADPGLRGALVALRGQF